MTVQAFLNETTCRSLRLSPRIAACSVRDAADRDVRNYVKERFNGSHPAMKKSSSASTPILRVCQSIIARQENSRSRVPMR